MSLATKKVETFLELAEQAFRSNPTFIKLMHKSEELKRQHRWMDVARVDEQIMVAHEKAMSDAHEKALELMERMDVVDFIEGEEDRALFRQYYMSILVCCDIIESNVMDMDVLLKKHEETLSYDKFDDIVKLNKMVKAKTREFSKNSEYLKQIEWGDACDQLKEMIASKVRKLYRKYGNL